MNNQIQGNSEQPSNAKPKKRLGCFGIGGLMLLTIVISVGITVWFLNYYLFPKRFDPVELSNKEQVTLDQKLSHFENTNLGQNNLTANNKNVQPLEPLPYSEEGAERDLVLSERELNAILARNTNLADKIAIDLSDGLISARLRLPMDPDFPMFGGKILKARAGVGVTFGDERPTIILKGASVMGVPIPNAWLGGLKNIDLVQEFGQQEGFWKSFSNGVDFIRVEDGGLRLTLKE